MCLFVCEQKLWNKFYDKLHKHKIRSVVWVALDMNGKQDKITLNN